MLFLIIFCCLFVLILIYLTIIIFLPVLEVKPQKITGTLEMVQEAPGYRKNVEYSVNGETIRSWLYLPENSNRPVPCIILSNGFGGTKDIILEQYARKFVEEGYAALALEYRHFGDSDGEPRLLYSSIKQLEDIKASVEFTRSREEIDPAKIFLWGTSAGGGYGINAAAEDHNICGIIAQCSAFDHKKDDKLVMKREGFSFLLKLIVHAQRDKGRSRFGLSPHMIPLVGAPGSTSFLNAPGALEGYSSLIHESSNFKNELCPRIMLMKQGESSITKAKDVQCPILLLVCEKDNLVAPDSHLKLVEIMKEKVKVVSYPIGHFDIYKGENFETAIRDQISFIKNIIYLKPGGTDNLLN